MLIERDGSDTPPSRFAYSAGNRAQMSHIDKSEPSKQLRRRLEEWTLASGLFLQAAPQLFLPRLRPNAVAVK